MKIKKMVGKLVLSFLIILSLGTVASASEAKDNIRPYIVKTYPNNHQVNVGVDSIIVVRFSEPVRSKNNPSFVDVTIKDEDGNTIPISYEVYPDTVPYGGNQDVLFIKPEKLQLNTKYMVTVANGAVEDQAGNKSQPYLFDFITVRENVKLPIFCSEQFFFKNVTDINNCDVVVELISELDGRVEHKLWMIMKEPNGNYSLVQVNIPLRIGLDYDPYEETFGRD